MADREAADQSLSGIRVFQGLEPEELEAVERQCSWHEYKAAQQIVAHRDTSTGVYFLCRGRVRVTLYSARGREIAFRDLEAGQMFGVLSAIDGLPRSSYIIALTDSVVAKMSAGRFKKVVTAHPSVALATLSNVAQLVRLLSDRVVEYTTLDASHRIREEILRLAREHMKDKKKAVIESPPTHATIANRLSTYREAVTREINELVKEGVILKERRRLVIPDVGKLAALIHED